MIPAAAVVLIAIVVAAAVLGFAMLAIGNVALDWTFKKIDKARSDRDKP